MKRTPEASEASGPSRAWSLDRRRSRLLPGGLRLRLERIVPLADRAGEMRAAARIHVELAGNRLVVWGFADQDLALCGGRLRLTRVQLGRAVVFTWSPPGSEAAIQPLRSGRTSLPGAGFYRLANGTVLGLGNPIFAVGDGIAREPRAVVTFTPRDAPVEEHAIGAGFQIEGPGLRAEVATIEGDEVVLLSS